MNVNELVKTRPDLFDGYDGTERTPDQQKAHDAHLQAMLESAPDHIKQAIADREQQFQADSFLEPNSHSE